MNLSGDKLITILVGAVAILVTWVWLGLGSAIIIAATQNPALLKEVTAFLALMAGVTIIVSEMQEDIARKWNAELTEALQLNSTTIIYGLVAVPTLLVWLILLGMSVLSAIQDSESRDDAAALIAALAFLALPANDMRKNLFRRWRGVQSVTGGTSNGP